MKKIFSICLMAIMALGLMGFGFAKWSQSVTFNGTVNTGNLKAGILDLGSVDPLGQVDDNYGSGIPVAGDTKDVASTISTNGTTARFTIGTQNFVDSITETITNAYPWYKTGYNFAIANGGTIPFKVESISQTWTDPAGLVPFMEGLGWKVTLDGASVGTGTTWAQLVTFLQGYQLHPGKVLNIDYDFGFKEDSIAEGAPGNIVMPQNASATAVIGITCTQWNEVH